MERKIAMVSGASQGMGQSISIELAKNGFDLSICSRKTEDLEKLKEKILSISPQTKVFYFSADLSIRSKSLEWCQKTMDNFESVDLLINNLGQYKTGSLLDSDSEILEDLMKVNFYPAYYLSREIGQYMKTREKGHIILINSIGGKGPVPGAGDYSITKFALNGLSQNLRNELAPYKVKVTSLFPGSTLTQSWEGQKVNPSEFILPEDIGKLVVQVYNLSQGANVEEIEIRPV